MWERPACLQGAPEHRLRVSALLLYSISRSILNLLRCTSHICGHEIIGEIVALGTSFHLSAAGAGRPELYSTLKIGDKVVSPFTVSCGECQYVTLRAYCSCSHFDALNPITLQLLPYRFHKPMHAFLSIWQSRAPWRPGPVCSHSKGRRHPFQPRPHPSIPFERQGPVEDLRQLPLVTCRHLANGSVRSYTSTAASEGGNHPNGKSLSVRWRSSSCWTHR